MARKNYGSQIATIIVPPWMKALVNAIIRALDDLDARVDALE